MEYLKDFTISERDEIIKYIINKFADEGLSYSEAKVVLERTESMLGDYAFFQNTD